MALLDRLNALNAPPRCRIARLVDSLDPEEATLLGTLLDDPTKSTYSIWSALRAEGHKVNRGTIENHRQRTCLCHEGTA